MSKVKQLYWLNQRCLALLSESIKMRSFKLWKYLISVSIGVSCVCGGVFCCFVFSPLETECSACDMQWMGHYEYPTLVLLKVALNRLSPTNSAIDRLAFIWMLVLLAFSSPEVSFHKLSVY